MHTLIAALTVVTLVAGLVAPARAAEMFTPALHSTNEDGGHTCTVFNKGTSNITVTIEMFSTSDHNFFCGSALVLFPKSGTWCFGQDNGFGNLAYCKITTTSVVNTRASIMVLGAGFQSISAAEAK